MSGPATERVGYRGYITPRLVRGSRAPQHVQNLVIRDYAARHKLMFKLSATEYVMPDCHMMLSSVLDELPSLEGIIAYSLFMLPFRPESRLEVFRRVLEADASLHFAVEGVVLRREADCQALENIWRIEREMGRDDVGAAVNAWRRQKNARAGEANG